MPQIFLPRNIELSVNKKISDLFTAPPTNPDTSQAYLVARNVYNEDSYQNESFAPVQPFIFLLANRVPPNKTRLPVIFIDMVDFANAPFELGNRRGSYQSVLLHIFARNRGERGDLAGYIRQALTDYQVLSIYDFTPTVPVLLHITTIEAISLAPQTIAPDVGLEGSLNNWIDLSFDFQVRA